MIDRRHRAHAGIQIFRVAPVSVLRRVAQLLAHAGDQVAHARHDAVCTQLQTFFHQRAYADEHGKIFFTAETFHRFFQPRRIIFRVLDARKFWMAEQIFNGIQRDRNSGGHRHIVEEQRPFQLVEQIFIPALQLLGGNFFRDGRMRHDCVCPSVKKFVRLRDIRVADVAETGKNLRALVRAGDSLTHELATDCARDERALAGRAEHKNPLDAARDEQVHQTIQRRRVQRPLRCERRDHWHDRPVIF